jgi:integrase
VRNGRRKAKKVGSRESAEKVKREIEARLALGDLAILTPPDIPTLRRYSEQWLRLYAEVECKPSTVASYRQLLRLYLYPRFGETRLDAITRDAVKDYLASLVAQGKLSIVCTLRVIFNAAVEDGVVDRNPSARLGRFTKSEKPKFQATALTTKEAEALLDSARTRCPDYHPLFLTALPAGLRRGELIALKWGDIQFGESEADANRYILVQRNYTHGAFTTPKSNKSRRVDLSRQLRRALQELRDKRLLETFLKGRTSTAEDLVFPSKTGTVLDPANMIHCYFTPAVETAGLRHIRFHDLRHSFGSLLIQQGASLVYVKEQMGHSSIQVTVDTYGHLIPGADIAWVDRLDEAVAPAVAEDTTTPQPTATPRNRRSAICQRKCWKCLKRFGEPGRTRTCNPLIKRPSKDN